MTDNKNLITIGLVGLLSGIILTYLYLKSKNPTLHLNNQNNLQDSNISNYKNSEKWKVIRDEEGRIINMEVIRDAKVS